MSVLLGFLLMLFFFFFAVLAIDVPFPFSVQGKTCSLIESVPYHCVWLYFVLHLFLKVNEDTFRGSNSTIFIFSSPGRSPGRAIVLPPALASALAKC